MGKNRRNCRRFGCRNCTWLYIMAALAAAFILVLVYPIGLLMMLLGAIIVGIVFIILHK